MALHHISTERELPHLWSRKVLEPKVVPRENATLEHFMEVSARDQESLSYDIAVSKKENSQGERSLHVTLPARFYDPDHFQHGKMSVWIGYAAQDFLDAPPVYETSVTRELSLADRVAPLEFGLPLKHGLTKPITVQIVARSGRQELSRHRIYDQEIAREEMLSDEMERSKLQVLR